MYLNYVTDDGEQVTKLLCDCPDCDREFLLIGSFSMELIRSAADTVQGWENRQVMRGMTMRDRNYCSTACADHQCFHHIKARLPRMR